MSIDYELGKQLREAGFRHDWNAYDKLCKNGYDFLGLPILEELIEACGEPLTVTTTPLEDASLHWLAVQDSACLEGWENFACPSEHGSTPAEAVARLWLALNKPSETG
jgi:hypothetical protein